MSEIEFSLKTNNNININKKSSLLFYRNERPFQCTICNKSYKTSSMRAAHMDSHINGKTFEVRISIFFLFLW